MPHLNVMKLILIFSLLLISCTNLKYSGWQQVKIEKSVFNKNCIFKNEEVQQCTSTNWFKQRATIFQANTVVLVPSKAKANYCLAGYLL
ncbi:hypothetical protein BMETH_644_2 [methanotrophic bacterial endosymbiont of Bathymodiolus sp.]|nr:hypothetical protein BMETH_644_2 [methanotrophic bacterial endosymbiont of Bathymodiolus sp.]